jgi:hypothetical protein
MAGRPVMMGTASASGGTERGCALLREPEANDVQRTLLAALVESISEARQGSLLGDAGSRAAVQGFMTRLVTDALRRLESAGYNGKRVRRRMGLALTPSSAASRRDVGSPHS